MRTIVADTPLPSPSAWLLPTRLKRVEDSIHTLHLFGSAGIAAFGWAMCQMLEVDATPWVPLWFAAGLFIYNVDRLRGDPADGLNIPERVRCAVGLRSASLVLAAVSALVLLLVPLLRQDWVTLAFVAVGTPLCLNYSIPIRGRRSKDIPYLKTFFAPTIVLGAVFMLPLTHLAHPLKISFVVGSVLWAWGVLLVNMMLCDLRDMEGDLQTGVASIPARVGRSRTRQLVSLLALGTGVLALGRAGIGSVAARRWLGLGVATTLYVGFLMTAVARPRGERFYERWVEGILFLPAFIVAAIP